ncbi:MAG: MOSC domain-containing protein [Acidobacteriota bacterium]|nr:MOSC domain-containing protein [Acidobacteriota bacterium]
MVGRLEQIWIKRMKRGPMDGHDAAVLVAGRGLVGNADQGGKRQITVLSKETWEKITAGLPEGPPPIARRANLLVSGIELAGTRGKILRIGAHRIRVCGETRPCEQMEAAAPGLQKGLSVPFGGGVFGEALDDGEIRVGDEVRLEAEA